MYFITSLKDEGNSINKSKILDLKARNHWKESTWVFFILSNFQPSLSHPIWNLPYWDNCYIYCRYSLLNSINYTTTYYGQFHEPMFHLGSIATNQKQIPSPHHQLHLDSKLLINTHYHNSRWIAYTKLDRRIKYFTLK